MPIVGTVYVALAQQRPLKVAELIEAEQRVIAGAVKLGLPAGRTALELFGFDVGVELGQIAVVALIWPVLRCTAGGRLYPLLADAGSAAAVALAAYWAVTRNWG